MQVKSSSEVSKLLTKPEAIQMEGSVTELLPRDSFLAEQMVIPSLLTLPLAVNISLLTGNRVRVKLDSTDMIKGRINYRYRKK
ncbi:translation initiation factor IF-1 [Dendronalium sp. ChiSLP03b]|uniref:translation initiation factor IF-1 n=1 Tax=Dendronalium sp. ChiSLP03b TaxID=3075381 RepID=UPI002AD3CD44|nr:translation initiation factor IF-1 [Dendronalium sp. ChiSLP03b]MDZ8208156.1 translation initiation factor IF-1 [Dendronalium sp. ChiSLP03b]